MALSGKDSTNKKTVLYYNNNNNQQQQPQQSQQQQQNRHRLLKVGRPCPWVGQTAATNIPNPDPLRWIVRKTCHSVRDKDNEVH